MATLTIELPPPPSLLESNLRRCAEVLSDPRLARLDERIETDRFGYIIMLRLGEALPRSEICPVFPSRVEL